MSGLLPGDFLLKLIDDVIQDAQITADFSDKNLDSTQAAAIVAFINDTTNLVNQLMNTLHKHMPDKVIGADDLLPGLACLIYKSISNGQPSLDEQKEKLNLYADKLTTIIKAYNRLSAHESISQPIPPTYVQYCQTIMEYLGKKIQDVQKNPTQSVLNSDDLPYQLPEALEIAWSEEIQKSQAQNSLKERQLELENEIISQAQSSLTELQLELTRMSTAIENIVTELKKTLKKTSSKEKKKVVDAVKDACDGYMKALSIINDRIVPSSNSTMVDLSESQRFLQKQYKEVKAATIALAENKASIHKLSTTKNNWVLQKLSDFVRAFYKIIKQKLPNWGWLHNKEVAQLEKVVDSAKKIASRLVTDNNAPLQLSIQTAENSLSNDKNNSASLEERVSAPETPSLVSGYDESLVHPQDQDSLHIDPDAAYWAKLEERISPSFNKSEL